MVVKTMGISARREASRSFWMLATGSSRSQARGDSGSVKPKVMSTTMRAGRRPKPPRPPKPSMCTVSPPAPVGAAELVREPLVELAARLGDDAPLLLKRRQRAVIEVRQLAPAAFKLFALR